MAIVTCTTNVSKAERDRDARAGKESEHGSEAATRARDATARAPAIARSISPRRGARGRESPAAPLWYRIWALIGGFVSLRNRTQARAQAIPIRSQAGPRWPEPVCANGARASDKRMIRGAVRDMPPLAATAQAPPTQTTIVKLLLIGDSGASRAVRYGFSSGDGMRAHASAVACARPPPPQRWVRAVCCSDSPTTSFRRRSSPRSGPSDSLSFPANRRARPSDQRARARSSRRERWERRARDASHPPPARRAASTSRSKRSRSTAARR